MIAAELATRRGEERDTTAEAEAEDRDLVVGEARLVQMIERGVDIHEDAVVGDRFEELHHLGELVVAGDASTRAMEEVGRHRVIAGCGGAARHVFDVVVDAERFHHDDHRALCRAIGCRLVESHRTVGGEGVILSFDCHAGDTSARSAGPLGPCFRSGH